MGSGQPDRRQRCVFELLRAGDHPGAGRALGNSTGLFALVNNITEAVRAEFRPAGAAAPLAALWYPAYWEDIEETPAHILLHTFSGQGYHYRQCFLNNIFLPAEYDSIFPQGHDADDANVMAMLCFDRLRYPWQLTEAAAGHYRAFLAANTDRVLARLLKAQDLDGIRALLALDVLDKDGFAVRRQPLPPRQRTPLPPPCWQMQSTKNMPLSPKSSGTILIFKQ